MVPAKVAVLAVAALLLAGTGVGLAVTRDGDDEVVATSVDGTTTSSSTTVPPSTTEVPAPVEGRPSATTRPPTTSSDDPVVRPTTPSTKAGGSAPPIPTTTKPDGASAPCPVSEVSVTVVVERSVYAPGQTVKGSTTIRNGSSSTCLLAPREGMQIEDQTGTVVGNFAYTMEFREPVVAAPGRTLTAAFQWDQKNCSGGACVQVPVGSYVAVARWVLQVPSSNQTVSYGPGQASFRIGG